MTAPRCPFCDHDPYHYVDNGVGMERVAVTCCELGVEFFGTEEASEKIVKAGTQLYALISARDVLDEQIERIRADLEPRP